MLRATFQSLLARKLRLLLSAMSIVLGVSFVSGAFVLTDSLGKAFDNLFSTVSANVAVDVRGTVVTEGSASDGTSDTRATVPADLLEKVRGIDGVADASPSVTGSAQLVGADGDVVTTGGAPTLAFNYDPSPLLGVARIEQGAPPQGSDEIALNRSLAEDAGYSVGDTAPVLTAGPTKNYRIVGIVGFADGEGSLGGSTNILFDTATAQQVLQVDGYNEITVAADDGVSQEELRDRIAEILPADAEAITGDDYTEEQSSEVKDALGFFSTFLLIFAVIALFVGAFIIFNTFSMLVAQRTRELALLRALGASRGQVTRSVLIEAVVVGTLSSIIGLGAGIGVAAGLKAIFGAVGAEFPDGPTIIAPRTIIVAFVVGILVTALAALMPSRRASRVPPIAALRDAATPDRSLTRQSIGGAVVLLIGAGAMAVGLAGDGLWWLGGGVLLAFIGVAMLSPLISRPVAGAIGSLFARALPGRLGRQNSLRNPRRTASTAAALMVGLALISAVSVLGASLKDSVAKVVNGAISADFVLDTDQSSFADDVVTLAADTPGVASAYGVKGENANVGDGTQFVTAIDPASLGNGITLIDESGSLDLGPTTLLMSEDAAEDAGLEVGAQVPIGFGEGSRTFTLGGTFDTNELVGDYLVDIDASSLFADKGTFAAVANVDEGADAETVRTALETRLAQYPNVNVQDRSEFVQTAADQVDQVVQIISILLLFSVIIAVLGVVNTLALSVIERTRELGLLRAIGMSRRQVKRMIRSESVIIAVFGGVLGLVVGSIFGVALQQALKGQGVSELAFPVGQLIVYLLIAALAGVAAAWLPARRASRLNVLAAVASD